MSGNICRCTGYNGIVEAILSVAARRAPDNYAPEVGAP
jgi:aerobic-type carbon monoxide dehydrogenase small subunit (CoxS/CutS family)